MARKAVDVGYDTLVSVGYKQIRYDKTSLVFGKYVGKETGALGVLWGTHGSNWK